MARSRPLPLVHPTDRIIGNSPATQSLRAQIRHLSAFDGLGNPAVPTVLLCGETGVGKGLVARVIHDSGPRAQGPFIEVNCAAIPDTLLEAELFGFEAGAFTDARQAKLGLFEAASRGTLFLDEIDSLPLALQGKLLTALEAKRVRRVGAVVERSVDVKLIAATPVDLTLWVAKGRFRADLYYRLAVVLLQLPPLRERADDALVLAQQLLHQYTEAHGLNPKRLSRAAEAWLQAYEWPGNVRELEHLMERITLLSVEAIVDPQTLQRLCLPRPQPAAALGVSRVRDDREPRDEAEQIRQALIQTKGNVTRAASLLGWSRKALRYRMLKYGVTRPSKVGTLMIPSPRRGEGQDEGASARQDVGREVSPTAEAMASTPGWEHKSVAVLALEWTWPDTLEVGAPRYDLWTLAMRWEQTLVEKILGFGGVILQHPPSLLTAAFGIPNTLEQLPQRAVQAALALRHVVTDAPDSGPDPQLRQAVHWGQLLVDVEASDPTARLLPVGETLGRPVRLLGQAAPGEILASAEMGRVVDGWCELRAKEVPSELGSPDQRITYLVVGLKPQPAWLARHDARPLSRFVGRAPELAILHELLAQVEAGRGQVVGLVGEPGVGKSRLWYEFARGHQPHGWRILETSADSYDKATPYLPVIDLLKSYFQIANRDAESTIRDKVIGKLLTHEETLQAMIPAFLDLLEVPVEDATWQSLDPPQRSQRTLEALKWLLLRESQVQPILLVVENLHWIDTETQAFLDRLIEGLPTARIFLLVSYRPEYQHAWGSKTYYAQLRLDPLPLEHAHDLLTALLGDDAGLAPLKQRLIGWTEGNPFFLEENVRTLIETGVLIGEPGAYRPTQALPSFQVPTTVEAVLAARMDRLAPEAKHLLQTAAVIGQDVPWALMQATAERPDSALHRDLAHLQGAEFLYKKDLFPDLIFTFKHAMTHEVAYGSLLPERRRALHARIVGALEALVGERLTEHIERLAHHALRGEVWDKAVTYCQQAGAKANNRAAFHEAVAAFAQALQALAHLPTDGDTGGLAIELRLALGGVLTPLGEYARHLALVREAEALARARADQARLGRVLVHMANLLRVMEDYEGAMAAARQALALAAARGEPALRMQASCHMGEISYAIGDFGPAAEWLRQSLAADQESGTPRTDWRIMSQAWLARALSELGAFAEARRHGEEALRLATGDGRGVTPIATHACLGWVYLVQGDLAAVIRVLEPGLARCRASGIRSGWLGQILACLGYAYALQGRLAEGHALLEEAISGSLRTGLHLAAYWPWLSEVCRLAGRGEEAWQRAGRALDLARQLKKRGSEARALYQLGVVQAHADPPDVAPAEVHYQQALALAKELGMRPLVAHCHLGLGTLYVKSGPREQARAELTTAIELYRAMDMTFWLPQAEAALAQVEGR